MRNDLFLLLASYLYVAFVLAVSELLRKKYRIGIHTTRKIIHIGVGTWSLPTFLFFRNWEAAIIPPLSFIAINIISMRKGLFRSMEETDRRWGTVYFPASFAALILFFWGRERTIAALSLMVLAWGDGFASVAGRRWGRRHFGVLGATKSVEGSAAMLIMSFAAGCAALGVFGYQGSIPLMAAAAASIGTVIEALSPDGLDNITVPVGTSLLLYGLKGI